MSNFSFSHNVFKSCLLLMCQNEYLWSKGLNLIGNAMAKEGLIHLCDALYQERHHLFMNPLNRFCQFTFETLSKAFPKQQILISSKLKQSADNNIKFDENSRKFSKRVENTVCKGGIARYLLTHSAFKRLVSQRRQKVLLCGNGLVTM